MMSKEAMPRIQRALWYFNCAVAFVTESKLIVCSFASSGIENIQVSLGT